MAQIAPASITVAGNVEGNIVIGDNNFVVNNNHGTIVYQQTAPRVQLRSALPQPPRKPRGFLGREKELDQLDKWIAAGEPVFIYGAAGLGKTSLAKLAANSEAARSLPNGVIFLEGVDTQGSALGFSDLVQGMFDAAYESQPQLKVDLASARTYLSNIRPLVLLSGVSLSTNNLETLADLFPNAPILIDGEGSPAGEVFTGMGLSPLPRELSIALLTERAALEPAEMPEQILAEMAELLSDIPGALATIGNSLREKKLTPAAALENLRSITPASGSIAEKAMERAYRVVLGCLSEDELGMLVQTGAAPGISVDRKWLEKVCGGKPISQSLEALELLRANSPRLRLAPGLRTLALEGEDASSAQERLLRQLCADLERRWNDFKFVQDELGNLIGMLEWCLSTARWAEALSLARGLDPWLTLSGKWDAWGRVVKAARRAAKALGDQTAQGWVLHQTGTWQIGQGDFANAKLSLEQARDLRLGLGDEIGTAYSQHNLDFLMLHGSQPSHKQPRRWPWILSGIIILALVAFLLAWCRKATPSPTPFTPATASLTPPATETPSPKPSLTPTVTKSPTATASITPSPSSTPSPTFVKALSGSMVEHNYCFFGPNRGYFSYGSGLLPNSALTALGRNDDGGWIYAELADYFDQRGKHERCWIESKSLQLNGDILSLQPIYPYIVGPPISGNPVDYPHLKNIAVSRNGDQVIITWSRYVIPEGDRFGGALYLAELWLCLAGKLVFTPKFLDTERLVVTDESGCSDLSHGRLFLSEKHGYIGPEPLWGPQVPTPTATSALTP